MSRFEGSAEKGKPSTQARRYVYGVMANVLEHDLNNDSEWLYAEMDEFDVRRVRIAVKKVIVEMRRKQSK